MHFQWLTDPIALIEAGCCPMSKWFYFYLSVLTPKINDLQDLCFTQTAHTQEGTEEWLGDFALCQLGYFKLEKFFNDINHIRSIKLRLLTRFRQRVFMSKRSFGRSTAWSWLKWCLWGWHFLAEYSPRVGYNILACLNVPYDIFDAMVFRHNQRERLLHLLWLCV